MTINKLAVSNTDLASPYLKLQLAKPKLINISREFFINDSKEQFVRKIRGSVHWSQSGNTSNKLHRLQKGNFFLEEMQLENTFPLKLQQSFPKLCIRSYLKNIIPSFIFSYPSQWHIKINKIELRLQLGGLGRIYNFIQGFWGDFPGLRAQAGMDFMDISTGWGWLRWRPHNSPGFHGQISPKFKI